MATNHLKKVAPTDALAKVVIYPASATPLARRIASSFDEAGWTVIFNEVAQEVHSGKYVEGVRVSGIDADLVAATAAALEAQGITDVRQDVLESDAPADSPKAAYIRVNVGYVMA